MTEKLKDEDAQVRAAAIRVAETLLKQGNEALIAQIKSLRQDSSPTVVLQSLMTGKLLNWPDWKKDSQTTLFLSPSLGVKEIGAQLLVEAPKLAGNFSQQDKKRLEKGQELFVPSALPATALTAKGCPCPVVKG